MISTVRLEQKHRCSVEVPHERRLDFHPAERPVRKDFLLPEFQLELRNPMSLVAFTLFLSVSWPMVMVPVNRGIPPTFEECEFLLCAQYVQAHEGCDKAELIERLQAHRRVIQAQVLSNDLLRKQSWLLWFWCRVR